MQYEWWNGYHTFPKPTWIHFTLRPSNTNGHTASSAGQGEYGACHVTLFVYCKAKIIGTLLLVQQIHSVTICLLAKVTIYLTMEEHTRIENNKVHKSRIRHMRYTEC